MPPDAGHVAAFCIALVLALLCRLTLCPGPRPAPLLPAVRPVFVNVRPDGEECAVCLEAMAAGAAQLPCGHAYHHHCIARWAAIKPTCPLCTASVFAARA